MKLFLICIILFLRGNVGSSDVSEIESLKAVVKELKWITENSNKRFESLEKRIETLENEKTEFLTRIETLEKNNAKDVEERLENLEELSKIKILRTCAELQQHGIDRNGIFLVDPDGELIGEEPIYVYCDFDQGTTEVMHDMEELMKIEKCETGPGCSVYNLTYRAPKSQIEALVQLSSSCTQDIQFGCFLAPLSENGINFGFWTDKFYNPQIFFTGSNEGQHVCQCSETNTCGDSIPDLVCQCDGQDPVWRIDQGTITAKHLLPITSFAYGPLVYEVERANFTIGRLKCSGFAEIDTTSVTCNSLKVGGSLRNGIYNLKEQNQTPRLGHCQMDQDGYINNMETPLGFLDTFLDPEIISFAVYKNSGGDLSSDVTYDTIRYNHGGGLDKDSGEFRVPKSGLYEFSFHAQVGGRDTDNRAYVYMYKNGASSLLLQDFYINNPSDQWVSSTLTWTLELEVNDVIKMRVNNGVIYSDGDQWINFSGHLIRERT